MIITVNGTDRTIEQTASVASLLDALEFRAEQRGVAVAVNASVVPRSEWMTTTLAPGDRVEILVAVQGG